MWIFFEMSISSGALLDLEGLHCCGVYDFVNFTRRRRCVPLLVGYFGYSPRSTGVPVFAVKTFGGIPPPPPTATYKTLVEDVGYLASWMVCTFFVGDFGCLAPSTCTLLWWESLDVSPLQLKWGFFGERFGYLIRSMCTFWWNTLDTHPPRHLPFLVEVACFHTPDYNRRSPVDNLSIDISGKICVEDLYGLAYAVATVEDRYDLHHCDL